MFCFSQALEWATQTMIRAWMAKTEYMKCKAFSKPDSKKLQGQAGPFDGYLWTEYKGTMAEPDAQ